MKTKHILFFLLILGIAAAGQSVWARGGNETETVSQSAAADGPYQDYSKEAFQNAADKKRVLFFHASWCPNCKNADTEITASLDAVPDDVVIFKTDYDSEDALKKKYGITSQHTFVYVDSEGNAIDKWSGGSTLQILEKVDG